MCARSSAAQPAPEPVLEPPRAITVPEITVPEDVALPETGAVQAVVVTNPDGTAYMESCEASEALCTLVGDAVARARFAPATRDGKAIAAKVRLSLALSAAPAQVVSPPAETKPAAASTPSVSPAAVAASAAGDEAAPSSPEPEFSATARTAPVQPGMRRLELAEMRALPGAFGDPYRAVDALPGVVPVLSGLPYFFVRGSPPASTLYIYDDIPVPTLYHLGIGPAVIHPRMVGPIRLYSGAAPARYGRLTGGAVVGEGPARPDGALHAEAELRLLDVSAYVQTPGLGGSVTGAVRYGYPALLLSIFSPDVNLQYWDYQLRYETELSSRDRFELIALGSYDSISVADEPEDDITITFHRVEPRLRRRVGATEYGIALPIGFEESELGSGFRLQATRLGPRAWVEHRVDENTRLRVSADLIGVAGFFSSTPDADDQDGGGGDEGDTLFGDLPARSLWGVQAELGLRPWPVFELQLGARADAWVQGAGAVAVLDPRGRAIFHLTDTFEAHLGSGVVHQPAVFFIPLPGIADVATDRGLQSAVQSEAGVGWDTPLELRIETQLFLHYYQNLVFVDTLVLNDSFEMICREDLIDCGDVELQDRLDGYSYGAEVFVRRPASKALSGWISYTLAWADVDDVAGIHYTPTWDVRHIANLVLQWNIGGGFSSGARLQSRSGKLQGQFKIDDTLRLGRDERRLPWFTRLDLELAYSWHPSWGRMRVSLEWFNATLAREPIAIECTGNPPNCTTRYLPAIFFPNLGLRGEI